jgi:hypothetical protein
LIYLSSTTTFIGAVIVGFTDARLAMSLLALFGATLRMAYKIVYQNKDRVIRYRSR